MSSFITRRPAWQSTTRRIPAAAALSLLLLAFGANAQGLRLTPPGNPPGYPPGTPPGTPPVIINLPESVFEGTSGNSSGAATTRQPGGSSTRIEWGTGWKEIGSTRSTRTRIENDRNGQTSGNSQPARSTTPGTGLRVPGIE